MSVNNKYTLEESTGWKFHSLNDINISHNDDVAGISSSSSTSNTSMLVHEFNNDGFITLSSLLTSQFILGLRIECLDIFHNVLELLHVRGEIEFKDCYRRIIKEVQPPPTDEQETILKNDTQSNSHNSYTSSSKEGRYEYPLGLGLKNGYRELVMRSPGRYELALLLDELPMMMYQQGKKNGQVPNTAYSDDADYEGKWLLSTKLLKRMTKEMEEGKEEVDIETNIEQQLHFCNEEEEKEKTSCLKQLLEWIDSESGDASADESNRDDKTRNTTSHEQYPIDQENMKRFMKFVGEIYPPPPSITSSREADGIDGCYNNNTEIESKESDDHAQQQQQQQQQSKINDYYLCNLSLLVATPGCPTQSWHADGGHVSLTQHKECHVFNVFIPLVDVPNKMGPTEIRPGTHYHTRNLAPMMLAAKARRTLRQPVTPQLKMGDALIFDYRVLHRGRANMSDEDDEEEGEGCVVDNNLGRDRPVLVLTFARRWFVDVCNFPKKSIFRSAIDS